MKVPDYDQTKPSGFKGLGHLPDHWKVVRGRFVMRVNPPAPRLRKLKLEEEVSFVPMDAVGESGGINLDQTRVISDVSSGFTEFQDGDVIVAKITPCFENGKAALARGLLNGAAYGTTELHVLRAGETLDRGFLFYVAISDRFRKLGESEMYGAGGQKRVPPEFNKDFPMPMPPVPEQGKITAFLDWKTGQIDALIGKKKELLEKLKEKRIAVITQAVTRGLNPTAPLKDSGIPWLGQVPQHWGIMQVRRRWEILDCKHKTVSFVNEGIPLASIREVHGFEVNLDGAHKTTEEEYFDLIEGGRAPQLGDIIYSRNATVGDAAIVSTSERFCMGQDVCLLRNQQAFPQFVAYLLRSYPMREQAQALMIGSTFNRINVGQIKAFWVPVPPPLEQQAIAKLLDQKIGKIDLMVEKVESAIARLTEYRTALITAATTGKIDVRGVKVPAGNRD